MNATENRPGGLAPAPPMSEMSVVTLQRRIGRLAAIRYMGGGYTPILLEAPDPSALLDRAATLHYFTQQDDHWRISERLRQQVTFKKQNLIEPNFALGKFDVVFCRNVLIYFDGSTKSEVLERIATQMNPGGFLMLGSSESVTGLSTAFESTQDRRGLFKLVNRNVKAA